MIGQPLSVPDGQIIKSAKTAHQSDQQTTAFCQLPYNTEQLIALSDHEYFSDQARRVNWKRIINIKRLMNLFDCQSKYCHVDTNQLNVKRQCLLNDRYFFDAYSDLHNIIPVLPKIARLLNDVTSYRYMPAEAQGEYIACGIYWQRNMKEMILSSCSAGMIARAHLYMQDKYDLNIPLKERLAYYQTHKACPPEAWEKAWNRHIYDFNGHSNHYIERLNSRHD